MNQFFPSPLKIAELQHLYKVLMQFMNDKHASKPDERQQHSRMCFKAPLAACRDTLPVYVPVFLFSLKYVQWAPLPFFTWT